MGLLLELLEDIYSNEVKHCMKYIAGIGDRETNRGDTSTLVNVTLRFQGYIIF